MITTTTDSDGTKTIQTKNCIGSVFINDNELLFFTETSREYTNGDITTTYCQDVEENGEIVSKEIGHKTVTHLNNGKERTEEVVNNLQTGITEKQITVKENGFIVINTYTKTDKDGKELNYIEKTNTIEDYGTRYAGVSALKSEVNRTFVRENGKETFYIEQKNTFADFEEHNIDSVYYEDGNKMESHSYERKYNNGNYEKEYLKKVNDESTSCYREYFGGNGYNESYSEFGKHKYSVDIQYGDKIIETETIYNDNGKIAAITKKTNGELTYYEADNQSIYRLSRSDNGGYKKEIRADDGSLHMIDYYVNDDRTSFNYEIWSDCKWSDVLEYNTNNGSITWYSENGEPIYSSYGPLFGTTWVRESHEEDYTTGCYVRYYNSGNIKEEWNPNEYISYYEDGKKEKYCTLGNNHDVFISAEYDENKSIKYTELDKKNNRRIDYFYDSLKEKTYKTISDTSVEPYIELENKEFVGNKVPETPDNIKVDISRPEIKNPEVPEIKLKGIDVPDAKIQAAQNVRIMADGTKIPNGISCEYRQAQMFVIKMLMQNMNVVIDANIQNINSKGFFDWASDWVENKMENPNSQANINDTISQKLNLLKALLDAKDSQTRFEKVYREFTGMEFDSDNIISILNAIGEINTLQDVINGLENQLNTIKEMKDKVVSIEKNISSGNISDSELNELCSMIGDLTQAFGNKPEEAINALKSNFKAILPTDCEHFDDLSNSEKAIIFLSALKPLTNDITIAKFEEYIKTQNNLLDKKI